MPKRPDDDWTRPIPRAPRPGSQERPARDWRDATRDRRGATGEGWDDQATERIPRQPGEWGQPGVPRPRDPKPRPGASAATERIPVQPRPGQQQPGPRRPQAGQPPTAAQQRPVREERLAPRSPATPPPAGPRQPRRRRYGARRILALVALALVAYVVSMLVVAGMVWSSIGRVDSTSQVDDRPGTAAGENYLLVGTDSRDQLTEAQRKDFGTGYVEGSRADTVMLLHVPTMGEPTLVSLPRDSYVEIRGLGSDKLNAAHSAGGPALLVDAVEQNTGLPISGYLEIGFGGFVNVVEKVGGVRMCIKNDVRDEKAHLDLKAGCQELTGPEALGYVRMRYADPRGDLGRVERQREFLGALVGRMASPATVLNPFRFHSVGTTTGKALAIGNDTSMLETARIAWAMKQISSGKGTSATVPVADANFITPAGASAVLWDEVRAKEMFTALHEGRQLSVQP